MSYLAQVIFFITLINCLVPLNINLKTCQDKNTTLYSNTQTYQIYHQFSCQCLLQIPICNNQLMIQFSQFNPSQIIHYSISNPSYSQIINSNDNTYSKLFIINFNNQPALEEQFIFQYKNQQKKIHFATFNQNSQNLKISQHSFLVLTAISAILIIILGKYIKIRRFQALKIKWYFAMVYWIIVGLFIFLLNYQVKVFLYFQKIVLAIICFFCSAFYIQQILTALKLRNKINSIYVKDIISCLISIILIASWILLPNNWILNDILAMFTIGSALKILKIGSIRSSLAFFLLILVFDLVLQTAFYFTNSTFTSRLINKYPSPLELQIPTLIFLPNKRCSWVEIFDLIFPGLMIAYCRRVDASLNSSIYGLIGYGSVIIAAGIQIGIYYIFKGVQIRQAVISVIICLLGILGMSLSRGEFSIIWFGGFYDKIDERIAIQKKVEWQKLTKDMEKGLLIN